MFKKDKCRGCKDKRAINKNCQIEKCVKSHSFETCAECGEFKDLKECKKLNNIISKIFGFVFKTDRIANLEKLRKK